MITYIPSTVSSLKNKHTHTACSDEVVHQNVTSVNQLTSVISRTSPLRMVGKVTTFTL